MKQTIWNEQQQNEQKWTVFITETKFFEWRAMINVTKYKKLIAFITETNCMKWTTIITETNFMEWTAIQKINKLVWTNHNHPETKTIWNEQPS